MNKISYIAIAFALLYFSAWPSHAEITVLNIYNNYKVSGSNIKEIRQSILDNGIKDSNGKDFAAKTTPKFTWKYNFVKSKSGCSIKSIDLELEVTYNLPELLTYESLSDSDKAEWQSFFAAIYEHEQGHAQLSLDTAKEIEWEIMSISHKTSCGNLIRTANMLINHAFNRHEDNNIAFDTETAHGFTTGAKFASIN